MNAKKDLAIPFNNHDEFNFFSLGRNAIYAACVSIGLKPGDIVITPALDCDSTLSPFRVLGLKIDLIEKTIKKKMPTVNKVINNLFNEYKNEICK